MLLCNGISTTKPTFLSPAPTPSSSSAIFSPIVLHPFLGCEIGKFLLSQDCVWWYPNQHPCVCTAFTTEFARATKDGGHIRSASSISIWTPLTFLPIRLVLLLRFFLKIGADGATCSFLFLFPLSVSLFLWFFSSPSDSGLSVNRGLWIHLPSRPLSLPYPIAHIYIRIGVLWRDTHSSNKLKDANVAFFLTPDILLLPGIFGSYSPSYDLSVQSLHYEICSRGCIYASPVAIFTCHNPDLSRFTVWYFKWAQMLGEVKNGRHGQMHVHAIFWSCTYTRSSFIGPMAALAFTSYFHKLSLSYLTHFYLLIQKKNILWRNTTSILDFERTINIKR